MKKINFLIVLIGIIFLAACGMQNTKKAQVVVPKQPNVLFIAVDDLNTWLGGLKGYSNTKTSNMDRLASQGGLFSKVQCQAPLCGPSRASIMSGLRPSTTGIYEMISDDKIRSENPATKDIVFLPEYFRNNGYQTMGIGKLFHTHSPKGVFDESGGRVKGFGPLPEKRFVWDGFGTSDRKYYGRTSTDWGALPEADSLMPDHQSVDWTIERLNRKYDKPFFLGLGFLRPHVPLYVSQKWFDIHPLEGIEVAPYKSDDLDDLPPIALQINDLPMMPSTKWANWDNGWGTRMFKWTYWGSCTSDGSQPALAMMADRNPAFGTAAVKNTELLSRCASGGLLHGGAQYVSHGINPCVHHTFEHVKPLAGLLDHWECLPERNNKTPLPRAIARTFNRVPGVEAVPVMAFFSAEKQQVEISIEVV